MAVFWTALLSNVPIPAQCQPSGLQFALTADTATAMSEVVTQGYRNLYASGPIREGDTARLQAYLQAHHLDAAMIVFDSPGGSLAEGLKLGQAIRRMGLSTSIGTRGAADQSQAICASACAYAFAGGVLRFVSEDGGRLGLHQFRSAGEVAATEGDAQAVSGLLVSFLTDMGVDASAFAVASTADPNAIVWLTASQAEALHFANNGVLPTTADVKISEMRPYLRLNQEKPGVTLRALFICWQNHLALEAGLVTTAEQSNNWLDASWLKRNYIEADGQQLLVMPSTSGAKVNQDTLWLSRELSDAQARKLAASEDLGIWLDGFGMLRAGGSMDLRPVRAQIRDYVGQCLAR